MVKNGIIYLAIVLLSTISCQGNKQVNKMILKCSIFPTGVTSKTYLIRVYDDGTLSVMFGDKKQGIENDQFEKVVSDKTKPLKELELNNILDLKTKILELDEVSKTYTKKGGWEIILLIEGKKYHFYHGELKDTSIGKLIKEIKRVSPVKIDIQSWS